MLAVDAATWVARMALKGTAWVAWKAIKGTVGGVINTAKVGAEVWKERRGPQVAKEEGPIAKRMRTWRENLYEKSGKIADQGRDILDKLEERDRERRIRLTLKHGGNKWAKDPWWYKPRADDEIRQAEDQLAEVRARHGKQDDSGQTQQRGEGIAKPEGQQPKGERAQGNDGNGVASETAKGVNQESKRTNGQTRDGPSEESNRKVEQAAHAAQANAGRDAPGADTGRRSANVEHRTAREAPSDARAHQGRRRGVGAASAAKMHTPGARVAGAATAAKMRNGGFSPGRQTPANGTRFERRGTQAAATAARESRGPSQEATPAAVQVTKGPTPNDGGMGM